MKRGGRGDNRRAYSTGRGREGGEEERMGRGQHKQQKDTDSAT